LAGGDGEAIGDGGFGAGEGGVDGGLVAVDEVAVEGVFDVRSGVGGVEEFLEVGVVSVKRRGMPPSGVRSKGGICRHGSVRPRTCCRRRI